MALARAIGPSSTNIGGPLVVTGMLSKQIACELGVVEKTVKVHRARVMEI